MIRNSQKGSQQNLTRDPKSCGYPRRSVAGHGPVVGTGTGEAAGVRIEERTPRFDRVDNFKPLIISEFPEKSGRQKVTSPATLLRERTPWVLFTGEEPLQRIYHISPERGKRRG